MVPQRQRKSITDYSFSSCSSSSEEEDEDDNSSDYGGVGDDSGGAFRDEDYKRRSSTTSNNNKSNSAKKKKKKTTTHATTPPNGEVPMNQEEHAFHNDDFDDNDDDCEVLSIRTSSQTPYKPRGGAAAAESRLSTATAQTLGSDSSPSWFLSSSSQGSTNINSHNNNNANPKVETPVVLASTPSPSHLPQPNNSNRNKHSASMKRPSVEQPPPPQQPQQPPATEENHPPSKKPPKKRKVTTESSVPVDNSKAMEIKDSLASVASPPLETKPKKKKRDNDTEMAKIVATQKTAPPPEPNHGGSKSKKPKPKKQKAVLSALEGSSSGSNKTKTTSQKEEAKPHVPNQKQHPKQDANVSIARDLVPPDAASQTRLHQASKPKGAEKQKTTEKTVEPAKPKVERKIQQQTPKSSEETPAVSKEESKAKRAKSPPKKKASPKKHTTPGTSSSETIQKKKKKKLTFQEKVLNHMLLAFKPFTLKTLAAELDTTDTQLSHLMLSLLDKGLVHKKEFPGKNGRSKELYWALIGAKTKEMKLCIASPEEMQAASVELAELRRSKAALDSEMKTVTMEISNQDLDAKLAAEEATNAQLQKELEAVKARIAQSKAKQVAPKPSAMCWQQPQKTAAELAREQCPRRMKIRINQMRSEWVQRKQKCMDFVDMVADGMEKSRKEVLKLLDIETDEMEGVKVPPKKEV